MLLHGLTATRRYVVMGSRALERGGHRVIAYDARGHGDVDARRPTRTPTTTTTSSPTSQAVLDDRGIERAVLAGASMGAHTAAAAGDRRARARRGPRDHHARLRPRRAARARSSSAGTRCRRACAPAASTASSRPTASRRCPSSGATRSTGSCASACRRTSTPTRWPTRCTPCRARGRSRAGTSSRAIDVPTVVVASRDEADPGHPYAVGEAYAERIPGAQLRSEEPGQLAARLAGRAALEGHRGASGASRAMISSADSTTRSRS